MNTPQVLSWLLLCLSLIGQGDVHAQPLDRLANKSWFAGSETCQTDTHPAIEVFEYQPQTFILRQNKCLHYEAPFIYLLLGQEKALLLDTGATSTAEHFPLAQVVLNIIQRYLITIERSQQDYSLLVAHSHNHSDHVAADLQFSTLANTLVMPVGQLDHLQQALQLTDWPHKISQLELGHRTLSIIPTPGHQNEGITLYDTKTRWLLTGDTFYPGRLYVRDWLEYKRSIAKLTAFATEQAVSALLGAHIEMSAEAKIDYPVGQTYHPNERSLVLTVADLKVLNQQLNTMATPEQVVMDKFIIYPLNEGN